MALNQFIDSGIIERYNRSIDPNEFDFVGRAMERKKQQQAAELNQLRILAEQDAMRQAQEEAEAYQIGAQDEALPQLKRRGTKAATTLADKLELDAEVRAGRETKRKADEASAAKDDEESKRKAYEYHIGGLTRFQTPEDIRQHLANGVIGKDGKPGFYSMKEATAMMRSAPKTAEEIPAWRDSLLRSTMTPEKQVATGSRETIAANSVEQRAEAARNAHEARLQQLTIAAQNAATAKERAAFMMEIAREKLEIQRLKAAGGGGGASSEGGMPPGGTPGNRPPQGKRFKPDGSLEDIPGSGGDTKLTEAQAKATAFLGQMKAAEEALKNLSPDQSSLKQQANVMLASGPGNILASKQGQQVRQAQEQWAEAFLRFKTGAAATENEIKRNVKTFFPVLGDSKEVISQKKAMRDQSISDMTNVAGKGGAKSVVVPSVGVATGGRSSLSAQEQAELDALRKRFGK